ncbi:hypothetical protein THRCLA_22532 [Thraustotheca clavata]|uniref:Uncharacterized protein n=1 Tax=Thraustotheca clavata TaxID=74557 RepID=A0A1V9YY04_9STRA|nr:hypothetical protein THRCLA_22532 [Thraustotheca clavata]
MAYDNCNASSVLPMQMSEKKGSEQSLIALSEDQDERIERKPSSIKDCLQGFFTGSCLMIFAFCPRRDTQAIQRTPWRAGFIIGFPQVMSRIAILQGNVEFLHKLVINGVDLLNLTNAMDRAAENGHLDIMRYLINAGYTKCSTQAIDRASGNVHFDVVKWLHENRTEGIEYLETHYDPKYSDNAIMDKAARNGKLNGIKYLAVKHNIT